MNYISNLNEFNSLIHSNEEVIIYPDHYEGYITMEYLQYLDDPERPWRSTEFIDHNICCVASCRDMTLIRHHPFNHGIPVLHIKYLPHFRETAIMIIAVAETKREKIYNSFKEFGFKNIMVVSSNLIEQFKLEVDNYMISGKALNWFMQFMMNKISENRYIVSEQIEIRDTNMKAFDGFKNAFRDKKIVIVGSGPTLKYYRPMEDAIHIGLNLAGLREDIVMDYIFSADAMRPDELNAKFMNCYSRVRHKMFIGTHLHGNIFDLMTYSEDIFMLDKVAKYFANGFGVEEPMCPDIRYHAVSGIGTIASSALHFALFTYPKEIYLVGCDSTPSGHFYDSNTNGSKSNADMMTGRLKVGYSRMKLFADYHYPQTKIISINPVGLKGLFTDVYTDEYKKILQEV